MYEYRNIDWLAHHGILNQRWGHRNGPPYPLSREVSTGSRLKKGASGNIKKKKSSKSSRVTNEFREKAVNNNQDMFNDLLYNVRYGSDKENDTKSYEKALKAVAKENGVNWKDLKKDVEKNFESREKNISNNKTSRDTKNIQKDKKIYVKRPDNLSEVNLKKSIRDRIDDHTITRKPKSQTSTPRFGEVNKDGKVIRTNTDLINEAVERGLAENRRRMETAVNSNQDMFNDILDRTSMGGQTNLNKQSGQQWGDPRIRQAEKEFKDTIKRVAKESGVSKKQLEAKVTENYQKRQEEIRALDNKRKYFKSR